MATMPLTGSSTVAARTPRALVAVVAAAALLLAMATPAFPADPPEMAEKSAYDVTSWLRAHGRGFDQSHHVDYQQRMRPINIAAAQGDPGSERPFFTDPYVAEQGPQRAEWREIRFRNRYGARLSGTLIAPRDGGPYPGIVIEPGGWGPYYPHFALGQGLAESGYVVFLFAAQGDHAEDSIDGYHPSPPDPVRGTPENEYCRPHNHRRWQEGEGGIREPGECAGEDGPYEPLEFSKLLIASATDDSANWSNGETVRKIYRATRARKAFGVLDAVRWLISDENPLRDRVDAEHIGAAGHSLGAYGALVAGQIDTRRQIDAVVTWDGAGVLDGIEPRVPTMIQHGEGRLIGPHYAEHDPDERPGARHAEAFREAGVPTALVTLADATHQEWTYIPYWSRVVGELVLRQNPFMAELMASSRHGERVALYYTLAWFDRYLKPDPDHIGSANARLTARTFDDSVDRVAIGQGRYDPVSGGNVPYTIEGRSVREHLSPMFTSRLDADETCADLREGC